MKSNVILASAIILSTSAIVNAQVCSMATYDLCIQTADGYKTGTCGPLQKNNDKLYQQCLCFNLANRVLCYNQCPGDPSFQAEKANLVVQRDAQCAASGLNGTNVLASSGAWATVKFHLFIFFPD